MRLQLQQTMASCETQFFDAIGDTTRVSDSIECSSSDQLDMWMRNPDSVESRRSKFLSWLGLDVENIHSSNISEDGDIEEDESSSIASISPRTMSFESVCGSEFPEDSSPVEVFDGSDKQPGWDGPSSSGETSPLKHPEGVSVGSSPRKKVRKWWWSQLRNLTCAVEAGGEQPSCCCDQRVKVHVLKKSNKELSGLYCGQTIQAHKGAILTLKFSPDGQFLASAGEDGIVRVWRVVEEEDRLNETDLDRSCVFFRVNDRSELKYVRFCKDNSTKLRMNSESACVVLPAMVVRISEKPLHEFAGHTNEVLDLSWSNNNFLLSSSVDGTVRLWRIGVNHCLKVFRHNNYVTCVQFNPVNDNHFISGSIDGKVRIWEVSCCKVVNWTEVKDIVTAVCYRPNGQGVIIGSITGCCRFYHIQDNQLQLDAKIFLHNKKKSSRKRITGFQFFPQDPSKVMVSCADSQVRIIQGVNVIGKYKGLKNSSAYSPAFLTSNGKHIISATEDNIYIWNNNTNHHSKHAFKVKSSERFLSNASVALPWPGFQGSNKRPFGLPKTSTTTTARRSFFSPTCQEFFADQFCPKGSTLWPEEMLASKPSSQKMNRSEYRFLRSCQSRMGSSNAWGLVLSTGGRDGQIRLFHNYGLPVPQ